MAKKATYTVQLAKNYIQPTHWRGGVQFERNVPQVLELTAEEAKVFEDDRYMEITEGTREDSSENADGSQGTSLPDGSSDSGADGSEGEGDDSSEEDEAGDSDEEEASSGEDTPPTQEEVKAKLLQKSRKAVDRLAKKAGVVDPEKMANKEVVVDAYLATQTQGE